MAENDNEQKLKNCIGDAAKLDDYLREKGRRHLYYKHYSKINRILKIIDEGKIYLNSGECWNDNVDKQAFNSDEDSVRRFGMCFSFLRSENVAMWMLYGGIAQQSGMIDFTQKGMSSILDVNNICVGCFQKGEFISYANLGKEEFKIYLTDIIYYRKGEKSGTYNIKRHNEIVDDVNESVLNSMKANKKSYPWKYENECRLIVSIDKKILNEKALENCNAVQIDIQQLDLGKSLKRVYRGPYCTNGDGRLVGSALQGEINWMLCKYDTCSANPKYQ